SSDFDSSVSRSAPSVTVYDSAAFCAMAAASTARAASVFAAGTLPLPGGWAHAGPLNNTDRAMSVRIGCLGAAWDHDIRNTDSIHTRTPPWKRRILSGYKIPDSKFNNDSHEPRRATTSARAARARKPSALSHRDLS